MKTFAVPPLGSTEPSASTVPQEEKKSPVEQSLLRCLSFLQQRSHAVWRSFVKVCELLRQLPLLMWRLTISLSDMTRHYALKALGRRERAFKDDKSRCDKNDERFKQVWPFLILTLVVAGAMAIALAYGRDAANWRSVRPALLKTEAAVVAFWIFVIWLRYLPKSSVMQPRR